MNCKRTQDFIITDYIDGQMGEKQTCLVEQHLAHCHACKDFLTNIKKEVINPLNSAPKAVPNKFLLVRIKQAIEEEQLYEVEKSFIYEFWEKLRSAVHIPKPAFALAGIVTMIFMIGTTGQVFINSQLVNINGQEQVEYLSSLIDEPANVAGNNSNESQTPIEQYFL